jgi:hypothetical protein
LDGGTAALGLQRAFLLPLFVLGPLFTHTPASPPSRFQGCGRISCR